MNISALLQAMIKSDKILSFPPHFPDAHGLFRSRQLPIYHIWVRAGKNRNLTRKNEINIIFLETS